MATKQPRMQRLYLFLSSLFVFVLHLFFTFAKAKPVNGELNEAPKRTEAVAENSNDAPVSFAKRFSNMYDSLKLNVMGLSRQAFDYALQGFDNLVASGKIANEKIISIADFSLSSSKKRLFVIDLQNYKVLFNTYVAHGSNSGTEFATKLSNTPESNQSSPGFYQTMHTYQGKHGYSLKLNGLERGINDNAYDRAIVIHSADYVNEGLAKSRGWIGGSWGCPALSPEMNKPIIDKIKGGSAFFIYSPDTRYRANSTVLRNVNTATTTARA